MGLLLPKELAMICVACRCKFAPNETLHHSILFNASDKMLLCKQCHDVEENAYDANDQQKLLETYLSTSYS
jgi:hypothetical protein